jgi:hypothetical protein
MDTILFECDAKGYDIYPESKNDENSFAINELCLIINLMDSRENKVITQTEISKESAIKLAKLILFTYEK